MKSILRISALLALICTQLLVLTIPIQALAPDTDLSNVSASFIAENTLDYAGWSISSGGDVNGDGIDDILIGADNNGEGGARSGQTYLIFGKESGWTMDTVLSNADASFIGENPDDNSGRAVAIVGDVNGDGFDDIVIGARQCDDGGDDAGKIYLVQGKATGWQMDSSLSTANASFVGEADGDLCGSWVSGAGDVNNDGYDDILIGSYHNDEGGSMAGQAYLVLGKSSGWAQGIDLSTVDASFIGEDGGDAAGCGVASAGDVNNDGYDDILIGAFGSDDGAPSSGEAYLILGKDTGWAMDTNLSTADASFLGESILDNAGRRVSSAGDVNGDGFDDILIGADENDEGGNRAGQTYLILGKSSGWATNTSLSTADASFLGEGEPDHAGEAIASAGDVNGDGYDDFLIGASWADQYSGKAYLIFGKDTGWAMDTNLSTADASFLGEDSYDRCGFSLASGNIDGDGFNDILISAAYDEADTGPNSAGQTYLILSDYDLTIEVSATLQGGSRPDPAGWEVPAIVKFFSPGSDVINDVPLYEFNVVTSKSGSVAVCQVTGIAPDVYDISMVSEHTLTNVKRSVVISVPSTAVDIGTLLEGNANNDHIISIIDFGIFSAAYGTTQGDVNYNANADFDRSGSINISDFGLLAANYLQTSPIEIP